MELGPLSIIALFAAGVLFAGGVLVLSKLISPRSYNAQKGEPYESGIPTEGPAWMQFRIGYYLYALLFLLFEVEVVFLFPWAVVVKEVGMPAFFEILIFLSILFMGLLYAWKKRALKWM